MAQSGIRSNPEAAIAKFLNNAFSCQSVQMAESRWLRRLELPSDIARRRRRAMLLLEAP
jgi:hypothetical protein